VPLYLVVRGERRAALSFAVFRGGLAVRATNPASHPIAGIHFQVWDDVQVLSLGAFVNLDNRLVFDR
jgi:hypothetical protein